MECVRGAHKNGPAPLRSSANEERRKPTAARGGRPTLIACIDISLVLGKQCIKYRKDEYLNCFSFFKRLIIADNK